MISQLVRDVFNCSIPMLLFSFLPFLFNNVTLHMTAFFSFPLFGGMNEKFTLAKGIEIPLNPHSEQIIGVFFFFFSSLIMKGGSYM